MLNNAYLIPGTRTQNSKYQQESLLEVSLNNGQEQRTWKFQCKFTSQ